MVEDEEGLLVKGMAGRAILAVGGRMRNGARLEDIRDVRGTCYAGRGGFGTRPHIEIPPSPHPACGPPLPPSWLKILHI